MHCCAHLPSGVEAVRPAPAGDEVGLVRLECCGQILDVLFRRSAVARQGEMGCNPSEIERSERAEKVTTIDGAQTVGQDEVVYDAGPERIGHTKVSGWSSVELFEAEERVGREYERPDLLQVGVGESEALEHRGYVWWVPHGRRLERGEVGWRNVSRTLPERSFGIHFGEERTKDLVEQRVEVGCDRLREGAGTDIDLRDGIVGRGGFSYRPEECVVLVCRCEALRNRSETLEHASR